MNNEIVVVDNLQIQNKIYTIRDVQVMLDRDLAVLYQIETRALKQAVKRNINRFPPEFMFELVENEMNCLVSQSVIPSQKYFGGAKPFAFTEQGVAMLSAVLKSQTAVQISIQIINAFVTMRRFIATNAGIFQRLDTVERKQLEYKTKSDKKFDQIFNAIEEREITPKQGIFFEGQIFDAFKLLSDIIRTAKKSITIIDNYIDDSILALLTKRKKEVDVKIFTGKITKQMKLDVQKYNEQYPKVELLELTEAHDRFIIIDEKQVYHLGASLKDLGKKWFAFTKMNNDGILLIEYLKGIKQ
ncbi:MAG: ORF6N domain-containing protein [Candidatus Cloacimonetes bacterium]|nr:ORF6N domain-containing protein [Candidatus Cloacimonadota bacterium]